VKHVSKKLREQIIASGLLLLVIYLFLFCFCLGFIFSFGLTDDVLIHKVNHFLIVHDKTKSVNARNMMISAINDKSLAIKYFVAL